MSACLSLSQSLLLFHLSFNKDLRVRHSIFTISQPNNFTVSLLPIWKPRPREVKETTHSPSLRRNLTRVCLVSKYTFVLSHCTAPRTGWPKMTCLFSPSTPGTCPMGAWSHIISATVEQRLQEERGQSSLCARTLGGSRSHRGAEAACWQRESLDGSGYTWLSLILQSAMNS